MPFIAYKITHRDSGKAYIGITIRSLKERWEGIERIRASKLGKSRSPETIAKIRAYWAQRRSPSNQMVML